MAGVFSGVWVLLVLAFLPGRVLAESQEPSIIGPTQISESIRENTWTLVGLRVRNPTNLPLSATLVSSFTDVPDVQFSTQVWVPARAERWFKQPVRIEHLPMGNQPVAMRSVLLDTSVSPERILAKDKGSIRITDGNLRTMIIGEVPDEIIDDVVIRLHSIAGNSKPRYYELKQKDVPTSRTGFEGYGALIIPGDADHLTSSQVQAVREWVISGGHVWIMADRVMPQTLRRLLHDDWTGEKVSETELSTLIYADDAKKSKPIAMDPPAKMMRWVAPGMEVLQTADGWPTAMWKTIGSGGVLVTTMEPRAMVMPKGPEVPAGFDAISNRLFGPARMAINNDPGVAYHAAPDFALHEYAMSVVGHRVIGRGMVIVVLGGFLVAMVIAGGWLVRRNRLEYLAPAGIVLAVASTGALLLLGTLNRGDTPLTVSGMQEAHLAMTSDTIRYAGVADVYSPTRLEGSLAAPGGTLPWPDMNVQAGHVVRMRWSEIEPLAWEHLSFPSSMSRVAVSGALPVADPMSAWGTFGPEGFLGEMHGAALKDAQDVVIVTPNGKAAPRFSSATMFTAGTEDELAIGQYANRGAISADRTHRIKAMRSRIAMAGAPEQPLIYAWTKAFDPGVSVDTGDGSPQDRHEIMLISLPLEIRKPAPGTVVTVPPEFIAIHAQRPSDEEYTSTSLIFNEASRSFVGRVSAAGRSYFRFQLPREALPIRVNSYHLKVDIQATGRHVEILMAGANGKAMGPADTVAVAENPSGKIELDIPAEGLPQPDESGIVIFGLNVNRTVDLMSTWNINGMHLTVHGTVMQAKN